MLHLTTFVCDDRPPLVSEDCPVHGKALRKRSPDDWTAIMGATPPNQAEVTEKGGITHVQ